MRVPQTVRKSNQSILKEISPEYSLERLTLKLTFQYFGHLMQTADSGKGPDAGKDQRQKEKRAAEDEMVGQHHGLKRRECEQCWEVGRDREAWRAAVSGGSQSVGHIE